MRSGAKHNKQGNLLFLCFGWGMKKARNSRVMEYCVLNKEELGYISWEKVGSGYENWQLG